jgi:hypothetical protein
MAGKIKKIKDDPNAAAKAEILKNLREPLATFDAACMLAGVATRTAHDWQAADPAFRASCARARAASSLEMLRLARVAAIQSGDLATLRWLTDRLDPEVRRASQGLPDPNDNDKPTTAAPTIIIQQAPPKA